MAGALGLLGFLGPALGGVAAPPPGLVSALEPELKAMLTDLVTHEPYTGQNGYGSPSYSTPVTRPCRIEFKVAPMVTATGEERVSSTRIFFDADFVLQLRDRLVLSDGTAPQIQSLALYTNEYGDRHHQIALF